MNATTKESTMTAKFRRSNPMQVDPTWTPCDGHTITKDVCPAQSSGESGFSIFRCTCGWTDRTMTGRSNWIAERHARSVKAEAEARA